MSDMHSHMHVPGGGYDAIVLILLLIALVVYPLAAVMTSRAYKSWPLHRYGLWVAGILTAGLALIGPLAAYAHTNFVGHMIGHLLLGMLAPLLLALAAPMTLMLRTLRVEAARRVTRLLKSRIFQFIMNPATAAVLNIGGLYVLYMTNVYSLMHESTSLYALVHLHVFLAGYIFTISIIYVDITSHRYIYLYRATMLVLALAGHKILAKLIYANPPHRVPRVEAEAGALWMYYGGDAVDLVLIIILCYQWYKATAPRHLALDKNG